MFWKKKYEKAAAERNELRAENEYLLREVHEFKKARNGYRNAKHNAMLELSRVRRELADANGTVDRKEEQVSCLLIEYQHLCALLEEHGVDPRRYSSVSDICRALNDLCGKEE